MVNNAFGIAVTTFVGQNFGAGKYDRMKKSVRIGLCMGLCTALTLTLIFYNFGTPLFRLFTSDENVVSIGMQMLYHVAPAYCLFVFIELLSGALRGTGDVVIPMLITCFGVCLLRIAWLFFIVPLAPGQHHRPQLPGHLGDHGGNVYRLLLLPGKEMAEIFCEKNGLILCR